MHTNARKNSRSQRYRIKNSTLAKKYVLILVFFVQDKLDEQHSGIYRPRKFLASPQTLGLVAPNLCKDYD